MECRAICSQNPDIAWMGGLTPAWIFLKDLSTCTVGALKLKGDHLSLKSDISPQKCCLFPRKDHSTTSI